MYGRAWETPIAVAQGSTAERIIMLAYNIITQNATVVFPRTGEGAGLKTRAVGSGLAVRIVDISLYV